MPEDEKHEAHEILERFSFGLTGSYSWGLFRCMVFVWHLSSE